MEPYDAFPEISYDDFSKIDLRAGVILSAEEIPKSNKLLKLKVSFGPMGERQILAGIKETVARNEDGTINLESLVGFQAMFVVNITPREMMGMTSHGMILAAVGNSGRVTLAGNPADLAQFPVGARFG